MYQISSLIIFFPTEAKIIFYKNFHSEKCWLGTWLKTPPAILFVFFFLVMKLIFGKANFLSCNKMKVMGLDSDKGACILSRFSYVQLFVTLRTVACQAPLSMRFSRQEYWSGLHALLQGIFPAQGSNPHLLQLLHVDCTWILYH